MHENHHIYLILRFLIRKIGVSRICNTCRAIAILASKKEKGKRLTEWDDLKQMLKAVPVRLMLMPLEVGDKRLREQRQLFSRSH